MANLDRLNVARTDAQPLTNVLPINDLEGGAFCTQSYVNNLTFPITLFRRDGTSINLSPINDDRYPRKFLVANRLHTYQGSKAVINKPIAGGSQYEEYIRDRFRYIETYKSRIYQMPDSQCVSLQCAVDATELLKEQIVYLPDIDIAICHSQHSDAGYHPYSSVGKAKYAKYNMLSQGEGFMMKIKIISDTDRTDERYINIGNRQHKVTVQTDINLEPGVYIETTNLMPEEGGCVPHTYDHIRFDELDKSPIEIFNGYNEALSRLQQIENLKNELVAMKANVSRIEAEKRRAQEASKDALEEKSKYTRMQERLDEAIREHQKEHDKQQADADKTLNALIKEHNEKESRRIAENEKLRRELLDKHETMERELKEKRDAGERELKLLKEQNEKEIKAQKENFDKEMRKLREDNEKEYRSKRLEYEKEVKEQKEKFEQEREKLYQERSDLQFKMNEERLKREEEYRRRSVELAEKTQKDLAFEIAKARKNYEDEISKIRRDCNDRIAEEKKRADDKIKAFKEENASKRATWVEYGKNAATIIGAIGVVIAGVNKGMEYFSKDKK